MNERSINFKLKFMHRLTNYHYIDYFLKIIPKYLSREICFKLKNNILQLDVSPNNLLLVINFLKNHWMTQYKTLVAITAADYVEEKERFKVFYFLLSYKLNSRIIITVKTTDKKPLPSITNLYKGANWYEREVWDLFGIFFVNHPDLRRILTDYGFEGFPFRKDFPQTGFVEIRYDDEKKYVLYEQLELSQEYRFFKYINPWSNLK